MRWAAIALNLGYPIFPLHNVGCNRYKAGFSNRTKNQDRDFSKQSKTIEVLLSLNCFPVLKIPNSITRRALDCPSLCKASFAICGDPLWRQIHLKRIPRLMGKDILFRDAETSRLEIGWLLSVTFVAGPSKLRTNFAKLKMSEPHLVDMQVAEGSCIWCSVRFLQSASFLLPELWLWEQFNGSLSGKDFQC